MAAASLPTIIILALGAAALGGPDALRVLLEFTGQSPCLDIAICISVLFMVTLYLLGTVLLVRFVRDARSGDAAGAGGGVGALGHGAAATATDCLAQVSLLVSACVGFLVAACLIVLPSVTSGGLGTLSFLTYTYFDGKKSFVAVTVAVIAAAASATSVRFTRRLLRFVRGRGVGNASEDDHGPAARASGRFSRTRQTGCFLFIALLLAAVSSAASGGLNLDAKRIFPVFPFRSSITNVYVPVGVAIATVAGTALVVRFSRRVRNAAGGGGLLAMPYAHSQSGSESDGGEHANSA